MRASISAAPEGLRSPRSHLRTVPTEAPAAREFLLRRAGLEPGRRHKRAIDLDDSLSRPRVGLPLRMGQGVLESGEEARLTARR
jgi:hypothetical protein